MLPLAIYLSDEFRLLDARTLQRALESYYLREDQDISDQLLESFQSGSSESITANFTPAVVANLFEPTSRQEANHNFNLYLEQLDRLNEQQALLLAPRMLHPRYTPSHFELANKDLMKRIVPILLGLSEKNGTLIFDLCNESRLHIQLSLLEQLLATGTSHSNVGITLSASSKRCIPALGLIEKLGRTHDQVITVRILATGELDKEIVEAQQLALSEYPILRNRQLISANYQLACRFFQSENCTKVSPILVDPNFIENPQLVDSNWMIEQSDSEPQIDLGLDTLPSPVDLFTDRRKRAPGFLLGLSSTNRVIQETANRITQTPLVTQSIIAGKAVANPDKVEDCFSPVDTRDPIGKRHIPSEEQVRNALESVTSAQEEWDATPLLERQKILTQLADLVVEQRVQLAIYLSHETGKPIKYALEEVRDAADLAYYYIGISADQLKPIELHSDQFSDHVMELHGRGVFLLTPSPEQPIAEMLGNLTAALVTGNGAIIKPPEPASLTCAKLFELALKTTLPPELIAFLPGGLREVGDWLLEDYRVDGVVYTGLGSQGSRISQQLASRPGAQLIPILVNAEGQSLAMVDSDQSTHELVTPILEQAVSTAGQYPLSSHVVYLEHKIADRFERALVEALSLVNMNNPLALSTDLGPVSTRFRLDALNHQIERMRANGRILAEQPIEEHHVHGLFIPPTIIRLYTLDELQEVVPGPLLYVIRFDRNDISRVIKEINRTGYGLALSLFSGDTELQKRIKSQVRVGNLNFNHPRPRGSAGALPIGGVSPSGTGPQIGGPNYLMHFTCERTRVSLHY